MSSVNGTRVECYDNKGSSSGREVGSPEALHDIRAGDNGVVEERRAAERSRHSSSREGLPHHRGVEVDGTT